MSGRAVDGVGAALLVGGGGIVHAHAAEDLLQHVPPGSALLGPAGSHVVVVAQVLHEAGKLRHAGLILGAGVHIAEGGTDGEETGQTDALGALLGVVAQELDEFLGSGGLGVVAVVKQAEAPDAAAQFGLAVVGGEGHRHGGEGDGLGVVGLVGSVPAQGHGHAAVGEQLQFVAGLGGCVVGDEPFIGPVHQLLQRLLVGVAVGGVGGVVGVGELAAVQVVHQRAGALVAALAAAVDDGGGGDAGILQSLQGLFKVFGGPGAVLVDVLQGACLLKHFLVDGHGVGGHAQGVLIVVAVGPLAGADHVFAGGGDVGHRLIGPQVVQGQHLALGAPVGDQALGAFHDDVGGGAGLDGGGDLVVTVGVVQVLHGDADLGVGFVELGDEAVHGSGVAEAADGVGPQGDGGGIAGGGGGSTGISGGGAVGRGAGGGAAASGQQAYGHTGRQQHGKLLLHSVLLFLFYILSQVRSPIPRKLDTLNTPAVLHISNAVV